MVCCNTEKNSLSLSNVAKVQIKSETTATFGGLFSQNQFAADTESAAYPAGDVWRQEFHRCLFINLTLYVTSIRIYSMSIEKYITSFEKYSWSFAQKSWSIFKKSCSLHSSVIPGCKGMCIATTRPASCRLRREVLINKKERMSRRRTSSLPGRDTRARTGDLCNVTAAL